MPPAYPGWGPRAMLMATSRDKSSGTCRHSIGSSGSADDSLASADVPVDATAEFDVPLEGVGVADAAGEQPAAIIAAMSADTGISHRHLERICVLGSALGRVLGHDGEDFDQRC